MSIRKLWTKFRTLGWPVQLMLGEALLLLGCMRALILMLPFRWIVRLMRLGPGETPLDAPVPAAVADLGWAVQACAPRTPWRSVCLPQALAGMVMLRRRGIPATLYLGVARDQAGATPFSAHAWLRCGSQLVTGGREAGAFKAIGWFAPRP